jgi:hypothetical protein
MGHPETCSGCGGSAAKVPFFFVHVFEVAGEVSFLAVGEAFVGSPFSVIGCVQ